MAFFVVNVPYLELSIIIRDAHHSVAFKYDPSFKRLGDNAVGA